MVSTASSSATLPKHLNPKRGSINFRNKTQIVTEAQMSEYLYVEKPFLDQLRALGWEVIDHGPHAIPMDPAASHRTNFREVTLRGVFMESVREIN